MFRLGIIHPYLFGGTPVGRPEDDGSCNINNVLYPHQIKQDLPSDQLNSVTMATVTPEATTAEMVASIPKESEKKASTATISSAAPGSTTADLAKAAPIEQRSNVPGTFPETPRQESEMFSVNPIPASGTSGNPIKLKPGEKVPDPSTFTSNTIQSTARTDPAGYAQDPIASIMGGQSEEFETSAFAIPPVSQNIIPESSLPMGEPIQGFSDPGVIIQSAAPTATTASLAAAVPLESQRHQINGGGVVDEVPEVVRESITEAHRDPEATVNRQVVEEKKEMENELQRKVPKEESTATPSPSTTTTADLATSEMDGSTPVDEVPAPVTHSIIEARKDPEAATDRQVVEEKKEMENELLEKVSKEEYSGAPAPSTTTAGPTTIEMNDSTPVDEVPAPVKHSIAEAHEEPEAAADTQVVEEKKETEEKVPRESTGTPAPSITTAGLTAAELSSTPVDEVPTPVKHSITEAHEEPEATANSDVVEGKKEVENELQKNVPKEESTGTPAPSMTAADPTTAELSSTPVDEVPTPVKHSITEAQEDPEATSNKEVVEVKKEVENELQQVVPREDSAGTPAPTAEAAATETVPSVTESIAEMDGSTLVDEVPTPVKHSITEAHKDPEAASNREVVEVKNEVEDELQQKVPREESMGAPAPTTTATMTETVPWAMESTAVGLATAEISDNAPVDEVPVPVKHSITEAYKDPEAATNREAVKEKKEVEDELQQKVPREDSAANPAPTTTAATTETAPQATRIQPEPKPEPISPGVSAPQGPTVTIGVREVNVPEVSSPEAEPTTPIPNATPDKTAAPEPETAPQATEIQPELEPIFTGTSTPQGPTVTTGVREANVPEVSSPEAESTAPIPNATPDKTAAPEPETAPQSTGVQPESEPVSPGTSVPQGPTVTTGFGEVNALEVPSPGMELIPFMHNTIPDKPVTSGSETSESSIPPNEMSAPTGQTQPAATPNWRYEAAHQTNGNHTYGMKNEVKEKKKKKSVWSRLRGKLKQGPGRDASTR